MSIPQGDMSRTHTRPREAPGRRICKDCDVLWTGSYAATECWSCHSKGSPHPDLVVVQFFGPNKREVTVLDAPEESHAD